MTNIKHVGRMKNNNRKVVVAYRVVPGDEDSAVVVTTENLMAEEHDALMKLVESPAGQQANELADAMARTRLPDGRIMLAAFHSTGKMVKVKQSDVQLTPNRNTTIGLAELNAMIAEQKGVTIADLAVQPSNKSSTEDTDTVATESVATETESTASDGVLSDEQLAAQYRSQADAMFKEAKRLREQAEELSPTKKKTAKKTEESA